MGAFDDAVSKTLAAAAEVSRLSRGGMSYAELMNAPLTEADIASLNTRLVSGDVPVRKVTVDSGVARLSRAQAELGISGAVPGKKITRWRDVEEFPVEPYVPVQSLPACWIFDIDGTLFLRDPDVRGPFDLDRCNEDTPHEPIVRVLRALAGTGAYEIVLLSGRKGEYREHTEQALLWHNIPYRELFMRPVGDPGRQDFVVKAELFDQYIRFFYNVQGVFDDRNQCVDLWRKMGVTCLQVAPGDF